MWHNLTSFPFTVFDVVVMTVRVWSWDKMDSFDTRDILCAKVLPLCLREFILQHGGVERLRTEVWDVLFCPEYLRQISRGKLPTVAVNRAHNLCNKILFDMAYEEGFLEKRGKLYPFRCFCSTMTLLCYC